MSQFNFKKILLLFAYSMFLSSVYAEDFSFFNKKEVQKNPFYVTNVSENSEAVIHNETWKLTETQVHNILSLKVNQSLKLSGFPFTAVETENTRLKLFKPVELMRYDVFAPSARIYHVNGSTVKEIAKPDLMTFSSVKDGIGLMVNAKTGDVGGYYNQDGISLEIRGNIHTKMVFSQPLESSQDTNVVRQCDMKLSQQPGDPLRDLNVSLKSKSLQLPQGTVNYEAVVAVDTDNEWMVGKGNNSTTAMNFIVNLFVNMNVYYERDFATRLLIGTTFLRISTDPYPTEPSISAYLDDFSDYWRVTYPQNDRDFALILSGQNISSLSFSGIAWLDAYCQNGTQFVDPNTQVTHTYGSYSVNRMGSSTSVGFVSQFVAHELGHNFGSPHTHCYTPEIDQCFNGESGCYSGAVSCPAFPGNGKGTIMSYCHLGGANGAGCGISNEIFHPTVISLISGNIASNNPSCIGNLGSEVIFVNGFETVP